MIRRLSILVTLAVLLSAPPALGQGVLQQSGPTAPGHVPIYLGVGQSQPIVQDSGPAGGGGPGVGLSELNVTARGAGAPPYSAQGTGPYKTIGCFYDAPITTPGGYHYLCLSPNGSGGTGIVAFGASNGAAPTGLVFYINGSPYSFPFTTTGVVGPNASTIGHLAVWNNATGTLLADGGPFSFANIAGSLTPAQMPALTGDVTTPGGSLATTIAPGAVTNTKIAAGAAAANVGTLGGDLAGSTLPNPVIAAGAVTGANIATATVTGANLANNTITYAQDAQAAANTVSGNPTSILNNRQDTALPSCSLTNQFLQWVSGSGFQCGAASIVAPTSPVRQTVAGGPVLLTGGVGPGAPNLLPATAASLAIATQNVSATYPLVATAANGFGANGPVDLIGSSTTNLSWTGLPASQTIYLYVTVGAGGVLTPGYTLLAPIYQFGGSPGTASGQFTFNVGEMRGYMGNGSIAPQAYVVFVGQVVTNASTVTSSIAYAYNGYYDSGFTATLPGTSVAVTVMDNLGVVDKAVELVVQNTTSEYGYAVGARFGFFTFTTGNSNYGFTLAGMSNSSLLATGSGNAWTVAPAAGGGTVFLTNASWKYKLIVRRTWGGA